VEFVKSVRKPSTDPFRFPGAPFFPRLQVWDPLLPRGLSFRSFPQPSSRFFTMSRVAGGVSYALPVFCSAFLPLAPLHPSRPGDPFSLSLIYRPPRLFLCAPRPWSQSLFTSPKDEPTSCVPVAIVVPPAESALPPAFVSPLFRGPE